MNRTNTRPHASILFLFCLFIMVMSSDSPAATADEQISKVQKAYEDIKDLKGSFVQKSVLKDLGRTDTYRGEFFIKPPHRMKWAYKGKEAQDILINGESVILYKKGDNQAYRGKFDRSTYGQTPVALLGGFGNIREEFDISLRGEALVLKPKKPLGNVKSIKVTLSDEGFPIKSFTINDSHSNVIEIELKDVKTNTGIKDPLFNFSPPKGVEIFDQDH